MVFTQCDACGKSFAINNHTADPNIHYFQGYDFCDECYEKFELNLRASLKQANNDMKTFLPNSGEVAKAMCGNKKK